MDNTAKLAAEVKKLIATHAAGEAGPRSAASIDAGNKAFAIAEKLTQELFPQPCTFNELLNKATDHGYTPTLRGARAAILADLYDYAQAARGCDARAYRGVEPFIAAPFVAGPGRLIHAPKVTLTKLTKPQYVALKTVRETGGDSSAIFQASRSNQGLHRVLDNLKKMGLVRYTPFEVPVYATEKYVESQKEMNAIIEERNARDVAAIARGDIRYKEGYSFQPRSSCEVPAVGAFLRNETHFRYELTAEGIAALASEEN